jgi:hypothetical protein
VPEKVIKNIKNRVEFRLAFNSCAFHSAVDGTTAQPTLSNIFANDPKHCFYAGSTQLHTAHIGPHILSALAAFKGNICKKTYIGKLSYNRSITFTKYMGVN